jgi:hypothetical protein
MDEPLWKKGEVWCVVIGFDRDWEEVKFLPHRRRICDNAVVYKFSENLEATSKFWAPERWYEASSTNIEHTNIRRHRKKYGRPGYLTSGGSCTRVLT